MNPFKGRAPQEFGPEMSAGPDPAPQWLSEPQGPSSSFNLPYSLFTDFSDHWSLFTALIRDAVDGPRVIVRDKECAVRRDLHVRGPAPEFFILFPSFGEYFVAGCLVVARARSARGLRCTEMPSPAICHRFAEELSRSICHNRGRFVAIRCVPSEGPRSPPTCNRLDCKIPGR